ncbi:nucleotide pyrophosphohydrolase [Thermococcus sp. 18S1]|uniref:nucleotide pyrophosphohydrolase n=1 Tax=Thermococcus sp. 18S1 TaxID=1638210 RepID=UPI00143B913E|nr:nucleotide pyrophosphohydrolase [Thermococcus sp. 18S1]NJE29994.1 nucleotide pyrophosphohydrolase [Thermococcus sp. 18S1]
MKTIQELTSMIVRFRDDRDWKKYHTPRNLAISLVVELGELLEHFQWQEDHEIMELIQNPAKRKEVEEELADVAIYLFLLANELGIELETAILDKLKMNEKKYPIDAVKGKYVKYTELMGHDG